MVSNSMWTFTVKDDCEKTEEKPPEIFWERGSSKQKNAFVHPDSPGARALGSSGFWCWGTCRHSHIKTPTSGAKTAVTSRRKPPLHYQICLRKQDTLRLCKQPDWVQNQKNVTALAPTQTLLIQTEPYFAIARKRQHKILFSAFFCLIP